MGKRIKKNVAAFAKYARRDKLTFRRLIMSVISLIIASVVLVTTTYSWFTIKHTYLYVNNFSLDCGKGLRVNDTGTSELSYLSTEKTIIPASSVDGRNLFFPTDGSDFSKSTNAMTFRSANVGDKNVNYIQIDFTLTAQQNHTALYINDAIDEKTGEEKTSLKVKASNEEDYSATKGAALRSALWCSTAEDGAPNTPIVFNPTSSTARTAAVAEIDRATGAFSSSGRQVAHAFSEYSFGGEPVATLTKGVETHFSYIVWLEGTDAKCTDKIAGKDIQINLSFTTSWDKTQTIRFKDETENNWVYNLIHDDHYSLSLHYRQPGSGQTAETDFNMYDYTTEQQQVGNETINVNTGKEWSCNIPGDMKNEISFILRPGTNSQDDKVYMFTYDSKNPGTRSYDRGNNRQYIAKNGPYITDDYTTCQGYWKAIADSDGGGQDNGGSFDGDDF